MAYAPQNYPRVSSQVKKLDGLLDDTKLPKHSNKVTLNDLKEVIRQSIINANKKSSRVILDIPETADEELKQKILKKKGKELFEYFKKYYGDPASTAFDCLGNHYSAIALEQFRNRTLQKERMNSGWRYQYIAKTLASKSKRFNTVSDIGSQEADFTVTIELEKMPGGLSIYVSVKNRSNTMGGQDWPKAINALETVAKNDKNRTGPYVCVFGIAMTPGQRYIKKSIHTGSPVSVNTEIWMADYFWPFFSNYSYKQIIQTVLEVLIEQTPKRTELVGELIVPPEVIEAFGEECKKRGLLDKDGKFDDAKKLVDLFCFSKTVEAD